MKSCRQSGRWLDDRAGEGLEEQNGR
jgi:hypothetical protein